MKAIEANSFGRGMRQCRFRLVCVPRSLPGFHNLAANGGRLNGFVPFPLSSYWHRNVSGLAPDPNSANYINDVNHGGGPYGWLGNYPGTNSGPISGAFWHVVSGNQPRVNVYFDVPQSVGYFTNGSATVTWVSGTTFDGLGSAGASMSVASVVGNWYEGSTVQATLASVGSCSGGSNCTTAVLVVSIQWTHRQSRY